MEVRGPWTTLAPRPSDRYEIRSELARGGMGRVLVAYDRQLHREVAIKELLGNDPLLKARFMREVLMTARLQHPSIVSIYESGERGDGTPYYVMRQIPGRPLGELMKERASLQERLALLPNLIATAEALAYAHDQGIVHRDLKPGNVMVGPFGETVVIDWGLAKELAQSDDAEATAPAGTDTPESAEELTTDGAVVGTPAFMAPEQARGEPVDARADVYALGVMLRRLLEGRAAYTTRGARDTLKNLLAGPPLPLVLAGTEIPPDLGAVATKAMAYRSEDRYPTAAGVAEDLRRFEAGQLVRARRYSPADLIVRWMRRHRAVLAVAAMAVVAFAALAAASVARVVQAGRVAERERERADAARSVAEAERQRSLLRQARLETRQDPTSAVLTLRRLVPELPGWSEARLVAEDALDQGVASYLLQGAHATFVKAFGAGEFVAFGTEEGDVYLWRPGTEAPKKLASLGGRVMWVDNRGDTRFLVFTRAGRIELWDARSGSRLAAIDYPTEILLAGILGDGNLFVRRLDGEVALWDLKRGAEVERLRPHGDFDSLPGLIFRVEGGGLMACDGVGAAQTFAIDPNWSLKLGNERSELLQHPTDGLALLDRATGKLQPLAGSAASEPLRASELRVDLGADGSVVALLSPRRFLRWPASGGPPVEGLISCDARQVTVLDDGTAAFKCSTVTEFVEPSGRRTTLPAVNDMAFGGLSSGPMYLTRPGPDEILVWDLAQARRQRQGVGVLSHLGTDPARKQAWLIDEGAHTLRRLEHGSLGGGHPVCADLSLFDAGERGAVWVCGVESDIVHAFDWETAVERRVEVRGVREIQLADNGRAALVVRAGGLSWLDLVAATTVELPPALTPAAVYLFHSGELFAGARGPQGTLTIYRRDGSPVVELPGRWRPFTRLSHDHQSLIWSEMDGTIHVWSSVDRSEHRFNEHGPIVGVADLSGDGQRLVAADWEGHLAAWDVASGTRLQELGGQGAIRDLSPAADGRRVVVEGEDQNLRVVDLESGANWALNDPGGPPSAWALLEAPCEVATVRADQLHIWDDSLPADPRGVLDRLATRPLVLRAGPDPAP